MDQNNFKYLYGHYLPIMQGALRQSVGQYGGAFCTQYQNYIGQQNGAYNFVQGVDARLTRMGVQQQTTNEQIYQACLWVLRDAFQKYQQRQQGANMGFPPAAPQVGAFDSVSSGMSPIDPDFLTASPAPQQAPVSALQPQAAPSAPAASYVAPSSPSSPFMGVTDKDLQDKAIVEFDKTVFERAQIANSNFSEVQTASGFVFGSSPQINLLKVRSNTPIADPNLFDYHLRKTFSSDLLGFYWGISVSFTRITTIPIPVEEYLRLCALINKRASEEGYTPELIIDVLKTCSQGTYEAISRYLVAEFNKLTARFVRSTNDLSIRVTINNLDGIPKFMAEPPKGKLTENPSAISTFAMITNRFFREIFGKRNAACNPTELTLENYATVMHNDAVDMWDTKFKTSKYGIALLPKADQNDWLARINGRMTFLEREEKAFITNIMSPEFISSVKMNSVVKPGMNGETRVLTALLRMTDYKAEDTVAGVVVTPTARDSTSLLGNYSIINPLEGPSRAYIERRPSL